MKTLGVIIVLAIYIYACIIAYRPYAKLLEDILFEWDLDWMEPWISMIIIGTILVLLAMFVWPLLFVALIVLIRYGWRRDQDEMIYFFDNLFKF